MTASEPNQAGKDTVLTIEDLTIGFARRNGEIRRVVEGLSLTAERGKTLCVVGESGSGKSMTARAILQILPAPGQILSGRIQLHKGDGNIVDITALDPASRAMRGLRGSEIGMIFQEPMSSLGPIHRIGAQICEAIRTHEDVSKEEARARAVELLRQVEIKNPELALNRYPFEYSGGMRQRAMIAIALACRPKLLIADEPTTALDVTTQAEILDLLKRLQTDHGMSMLFITHDMGVVAEIADEIVVMRHGKAVEQGGVHEIFAQPRQAYTQVLLDSARRLEGLEVSETVAAPDELADRPVVLSVRNLEVSFGGSTSFFGGKVPGIKAVDNVSFDLFEGEALGIVGESGSGKTTLVRSLLRIVPMSAGQAVYTDAAGKTHDLANAPTEDFRHLLSQIRMVFQDPFASLNPRMTIGDIIAEPLHVMGLDKTMDVGARVDELLERVELPRAFAARYPHALSGGQRQRIGIARALAPKPRIIIADEATAALDVSLRVQVLDLMALLKQELGISYIFIGHDIGVVRYFCDRIGVMYSGEMVELGDAEQVATAPRHAYTKALLSAIPMPDPTQRKLHQRVKYIKEATA